VIDTKALSQKLSELASTDTKFVDGARVLSDGENVPVLQAVLRTIDETVLDRKLTFRIGKSYVTMVVAGRRLQGMTKLSGDLDGALKVMGKIIARDDSELLDVVASVMTQFAEREGQLTVTSEPTEKLGEQSDAGVGLGTLTASWDVDMSSEPPTPLGQFIINCGASVNASLVIAQGEIIRAKGDQEIQDKLHNIAKEQWSTFVDAHAKLREEEASKPALVCLNSGIGDDTSLAVAKKDEEVSVFVFESAELPAVYSAWRDVAVA